MSLTPQPAFSDGVIKPGTVLLGRAAFLEQERAVDLLDVDAAVLHRLGRVGDLQQLAGGDGGTRRDVMRQPCLPYLHRALRASISAKGRAARLERLRGVRSSLQEETNGGEQFGHAKPI